MEKVVRPEGLMWGVGETPHYAVLIRQRSRRSSIPPLRLQSSCTDFYPLLRLILSGLCPPFFSALVNVL